MRVLVPSPIGRLISLRSASIRGAVLPSPATMDDAFSSSDRSVTRMSNTLPPSWSLSSSAVPRATTRPVSRTMMLSARCSASSMYWVVSSTVVPSDTRSWMNCQRSLRVRGSSPVVGSSRNSTGGRPMRLAARSSRRLMPPE